MIVTLLVSTGAAWESRALEMLNRSANIVVLKRCVDVDDLLATASAGQARVAVLGAELPGLDRAVVEQLGGYGVRAVTVLPGDPDGHGGDGPDDAAVARARQVGLVSLVSAGQLDRLPDAVREEPAPVTAAAPTLAPAAPVSAPPDHAGPGGRVLAVWGPGGAPGRTTVATALAAELARRRLLTLLVDADPYGGAVAQQLGILDEVSGLLAAARLAAAGSLAERFPTVQRRLADRLRVVTGLPRPDRWAEVRPGTLSDLVDHARADAQVVLDTGFSLERDPVADVGVRAERNGLTVEALEAADEIVVVGAADPIGLARLARAVAEVREAFPASVVRVVVNRMRSTLGWREADVAAMLDGFGPVAGIHFLPDDQPAVDRALVAGRTLLEAGESPLTRAVAGLVDAMAGIRR